MPKKQSPPDARNAITQELFDALNRESDRAAVLIGASVLDAQLEDLFRASLLPFTPSASYDAIYEANGPLASFSARINLSHCLGWISDEARRDLHSVRSLRNRFAHGFEHNLSLRDPEFAPTLDSFRLIKNGDDFLRELIRTVDSREAVENLQKHIHDPRRKFVSAVGTLALLLSFARERAQPPVAKTFELVPLPQKELTLEAGEVAEIDSRAGRLRNAANTST